MYSLFFRAQYVHFVSSINCCLMQLLSMVISVISYLFGSGAWDSKNGVRHWIFVRWETLALVREACFMENTLFEFGNHI